MIGHVLQTANPIVNVEVCVSKPGITIVSTAAPFPLRHVIIEVYVDLLLCKLSRNCIKYLDVLADIISDMWK